jgi:hypothetical protein
MRVKLATFRAGPFSQKATGLNPGTYTVEVSSPLAALQPPQTWPAIGNDGAKLQGPLANKSPYGGKSSSTRRPSKLALASRPLIKTARPGHKRRRINTNGGSHPARATAIWCKVLRKGAVRHLTGTAVATSVWPMNQPRKSNARCTLTTASTPTRARAARAGDAGRLALAARHRAVRCAHGDGERYALRTNPTIIEA